MNRTIKIILTKPLITAMHMAGHMTHEHASTKTDRLEDFLLERADRALLRAKFSTPVLPSTTADRLVCSK